MSRRSPRMNRRGIGAQSGAAAAPFSGNFIDIFPGALQLVQTDLGLTYGGTMLASGTTPPVLTLSGALVGKPVPIKFTVGVTGALGVWTWLVSYDGGSTIDEVGTSAAGPTPLRAGGPGNGLSVSMAAGNAASDNVWVATCAGLADQTAGAKHYSQAGATQQPVVTVGLGGNAGILADGVNDAMSSALALPAPGTTPTWVGMVFRQITWVTAKAIVGNAASAAHLIYSNSASPNLRQFNATNGPLSSLPLNTWEATEAAWTNSVADYFKRGSTAAVTGTNTANTASADRYIFGGSASAFMNVELLMLVYMASVPSAGVIAKWRAAVTSKYGGTVSV